MYQKQTDLQKYTPFIFVGVIIVAFIIVIAAFAGSNPQGASAQITVQTDVVGSGLRVVNGSERVTQIDWGMLAPGNTYTQSATIECDGTAQVTVEASAFNPENARSYLSFNSTCTYCGVVTPYSSVTVTFKLSVADNATAGNFTFIITVYGSEPSDRFVQAYGDWQIYISDVVYFAVHPESRRILCAVELAGLKALIEGVKT